MKVLFSHQDFYIVYKPENVNFHDEGDVLSGFFNQCNEYFKESLFPVHRLDKLTSGLVIVARNKVAATWFQQAFENKKIEKYYVAISDKKPKKKQGSIIGDMEKSRRSQWKLLPTKTNPAITRFFSYSNTTLASSEWPTIRMFLLKPETGRTHQLRVALKSVSAPILGDALYGGSQAERGYLHAGRLDFDYNGLRVSVIAPLKFVDQFERLNSMVENILQDAHLLSWPGMKKRAV